MPPRVAVVGAGIIGLSTAILAQERIPRLQVTLISEKFSPETTSDVAAGLWKPHCLKDTREDDIYRWAGKTYSHMLKLWQSPEAEEVGICLISKFELSARKDQIKPELPNWSKVPLAYKILNKEQVQKLSGNKKFTCGAHFITFTLEPSRYLPYLLKKFQVNGGTVQQRKVLRLEDLFGEFDVVINCSGVQAHHLVPDASVKPLRGQVLKVNAPWMSQIISETKDGGNYIIPNIDHVVLGGTHQEDDWNNQPDSEDTKSIFQGCCELIPGLKDVEIIKEVAGLRPGRPSVCLESHQITDGYGNKLDVIHNYGHGGGGVTLSWGCAQDAVNILQEILNNSPSSKNFTSKL